MISHEADGDIYAVTLTVPGRIITPDQWRRLAVPLRRRLLRDCVAAVWRLAVQLRGQPHLHLIATAPESMPCAPTLVAGVRGYWLALWLEMLDTLPPCPGTVLAYDGYRRIASARRSELFGVLRHSVKVDPDNGTGLWYRYLCDHTSKQKQAQVCGWAGFRHWGICSRSRFHQVDPVTIGLDRSAFGRVYRWLRLSCRRRVRDPRCPFGWRHGSSPRRSCDGTAVWFGYDPATVRKLAALARGQEGLAAGSMSSAGS